MEVVKTLTPKLLRPTFNPSQFKFTTTAELTVLADTIGQERATEALEFGVEIDQPNYNLYVIGAPGVGKRTFIDQYLQKVASKQPTPSDWCYVYNFEDPLKPYALQFPAGYGKKFRQDMLDLIEQFRFSIPAALEGEEYITSIKRIEKKYKESEEQTLKNLKREAERKETTISRTSNGYVVLPMRNGKAMSDQEMKELPEKEKNKRARQVTQIGEKLLKTMGNIAQWHKDKYQKEKEVEKEFCATIITILIGELKKRYIALPRVLDYLRSVQQNVIDNPKDFLKSEENSPVSYLMATEKLSFSRYQVNVFVSNDDIHGAPIIFEANPTYSNLTGKLEYEAQFGFLSSDYTLIKPGSLHKANGGYLVLDILKVLNNPYAWDSLKRILLSKQITIEPLGQMLGIAGTTSLEPEAIPLNIKIILTGDRYIYHLLCSIDDEFKKLFKVAVDFEDDIECTLEIAQKYAQLIARLVIEYNLSPFHRNAVSCVIDYCTRLTGNSERISLHMQSLVEILSEANHWALKSGNKIVRDIDVQQAIDIRIKRVDQLRRRVYQEIENGSIFIDVNGKSIGQINAVSIIETSDFIFGHASRITATTWLGDGEVIDIEREAKLSGPIHSKGVLILSGFLKERYGKDRLLSLSASLVFEQTYGMVEGDSASLAELCALLSSLAEVPIKQTLAVTGSVNQHGQVQAVGCINEKIEGFFDICQKKGLTGEQGILIPATNIKNLMLRQDVVDAVSNNAFHVYPIKTIDEALFLLLGKPIGTRGKNGHYPSGSINYLCEKALQKFTDLRRQHHMRKGSLKTR